MDRIEALEIVLALALQGVRHKGAGEQEKACKKIDEMINQERQELIKALRTGAKDYLIGEHRGCPYCGSTDIEFRKNEPNARLEENFIYDCKTCDKTWTEIFHRKGVILDGPCLAGGEQEKITVMEED